VVEFDLKREDHTLNCKSLSVKNRERKCIDVRIGRKL